MLTRVHKIANICNRANYLSQDPSAHDTPVHALIIRYRLPLTATLFSPCTSVKKGTRTPYSVRMLNIYDMVQRRTNVLGNVYRKLRRGIMTFYY